jgi:excisionase family DNA binding protein
MAEDKLLTIRDVSIILGISEKEVMDLAENGSLPAYKIGGVYLRFKAQQVEDYKKRLRPSLSRESKSREYSLRDKVNDFLYFNDFYILSSIIIAIILIVIFKGY